MDVTAQPVVRAKGGVLAGSVTRAYLELVRPANVITAAADILAGSAVAGGWNEATLLLVPSGMSLYAGGVVLNDYFDRSLDAGERPERAIPSGRASAGGAAWLGLALLFAGIGFAWLASPLSAALAGAIAGAAVLYDWFSKHYSVIGPLNMGLCRGLNLMLGISAGSMLSWHWSLLAIPLLYIAAVTQLAKGEVHGGSRTGVFGVMAAVATVIAAVVWFGVRERGVLALWCLPFLAWLGWRVFRPLVQAARQPVPQRIFGAVKAGVLSLMVLDAALAAALKGPEYGVGILSLTVVAGWLARKFAVT